MQDLTHTRIGKYEVTKRLASGGMGQIYLARQTGIAGFERVVIVKTMLPNVAAGELSLEQFFDEARLAATLNHPNVVSIYELGQHKDLYFIAMEYIHGIDLSGLRKLLRNADAQVPPRVAAAVIRGAALGLEYAHNAVDINGQPINIVHRDVSPQNIMVRLDGGVKVVDFGIAHAANRLSKTEDDSIKGKLLYMSPELIRGEAISASSDQFGLGAVAWELLTLQHLFFADNAGAIMQRVLHKTVSPPSALRPEVPPELDAVLLRMLERDPARRFASCADVALALQAYLDASGGIADHEVAAFINQHAGAEIAERQRVPLAAQADDSAALELEQTLVSCPSCQHWHRPDAQFCTRCGARMDGSAPAAEEHLAPPPSPGPQLPGLDLIEISRSHDSSKLRGSDQDAGVMTIATTQAGAAVIHEGGQTYIDFGDTVESQVLELDSDEQGPRFGPPEPLFRGRAHELALLSAALAAAEGGQAGGVLLVGEEGAGKSRLLGQLHAQARQRGFVVANAVSLRRGMPLSLDIFRQWVIDLNDGFRARRRKPDEEAPATVRESFEGVPEKLVPIPLQRRLVQLLDAERCEPLGDAMAHGQRQVAALVQYLSSLCEAKPVCLIVDDVQHADPVSVDLIQLLPSRLARSRLCIAASSTVERAGRVRQGLQIVAMAPLPLVDLLCIAQDLLTYGDRPPDLEQRFEQLRGNPALAVHLVRRLLRDGGDLSSTPVPARARSQPPAPLVPSLADCVTWLLQQLSDASRELLQIAALAGEVFPVALLEAHGAGNADQVRIAVFDALQAGLIVGEDLHGAHMRFAQGSFRGHLLAGLPREALARLRARVTASLSGCPAIPAHEAREMAALHTIYAGQSEMETLHAVAQLAPTLLAQGLIVPALELLRRGYDIGLRQLTSGRVVPADLAPLLLRLTAQLAFCQQRIEPEQGCAQVLRLLTLLPSGHAPSERALALLRLAQSLRGLGRYQQAATALEQGLALTSALSEPVLHAMLEAEKAILLGERGNEEEAVFLFSEALDTLGQTPTQSGEVLIDRYGLLGELYRELGRLYQRMDRPDLACETAIRALEIARYAELIPEEIRAWLLHAEVEPDEATASTSLEEAARLAQSSADSWLLAEVSLAQYRSAKRREDRAAGGLLQRALRAAQLSGHREVVEKSTQPDPESDTAKWARPPAGAAAAAGRGSADAASGGRAPGRPPGPRRG